jgi:hypothetical protein
VLEPTHAIIVLSQTQKEDFNQLGIYVLKAEGMNLYLLKYFIDYFALKISYP